MRHLAGVLLLRDAVIYLLVRADQHQVAHVMSLRLVSLDPLANPASPQRLRTAAADFDRARQLRGRFPCRPGQKRLPSVCRSTIIDISITRRLTTRRAQGGVDEGVPVDLAPGG